MSEIQIQEYIPVGKRTRLQQAKKIETMRKNNKRARIAAKKEFLKKKKEEKCSGYISCTSSSSSNNDDDNGGFEDAILVDESEFNKGLCLLEYKKDSDVRNDVEFFNDDEKGKSIVIVDANDDVMSDDSLQFLGERWNFTGVRDESESEDDANGDGDNGGKREDDKGLSTEFESSEEDDDEVSDRDFTVENAEVRSCSESASSSSDDSDDDVSGEEVVERKKVRIKDKKVGCVHNDGDHDDNEVGFGGRLITKEKRGKRKKERASGEKEKNDGFGIRLAAVKEKYIRKGESSSKKTSIIEKISKHGSVDRPVSIDPSSAFRSRPHGDDSKVAQSLRGGEGCAAHDEYSEELERGRAMIDEDVVLEPPPPEPKKKSRKMKLKPKEVENILLNTILEKGTAAGLEGIASTVTDDQEDGLPRKEDEDLPLKDDLPRKFTLGEKAVVPEKTQYEQELEDLFKELDFALGVCDIGLETSFAGGKEEESAELCASAALQEKLCRQGKHYLILDEEVGIKCKFCSVLMLEIRDVTPDFNENPFGSSKNARLGRISNDEDISADRFQFPESNSDFGAAQKDGNSGLVWDLIPGIKETLYEHQQKGFEFIWRNVSGGIKLEELDTPSGSGIGGCIICHAPGTGKTRLAIVFLQSYLKKYPLSKPVIIAPSSMLLTWEEQFALWHVHVPFLNLNNPELSRKESEVLGFVGNVNHSKAIRKAKLCIWAMGKGILGISYTLFEKLAGERKGTDERIKRALLEQSGILILDEGHTPRNEDSNIWKVFSEVHTKKRVILSGTPFQNNFDELNNTLSIIREEFRDPFLRGNYVNRGRQSKINRRDFFNSKVHEEHRIEDLRNRMKPFVHVHKGEILRTTLRGLFHSVLVLKPSELQKRYFRYLAGIRNGLLSDYLVSIVSVHPSLLSLCEQVPNFVDKDLLNEHKTNLEAGIKVKFLLELIKLSKGEKVLVFSQFLHPLTFIGELLNLIFKWTEGNEYLLMVGAIRPKQRQSLITLFNDPTSEARVLLASTKACSEGIHLVGASRVVLLDVVWNPSVERQAISRAYRLGQKKDVYVYHLITSGTQEGEKYYRQVAKDRVSEQVFTSTEGEGGQKTNTLTRVSEDRILEEMIQHEKMKDMFKEIIYQPKADKLIESFAPLNQ